MKRRHFLKGIGGAALLPILSFPLLSCADDSVQSTTTNSAKLNTHMPEESEAHEATWMAYGATAQAWGTTGAYGASRALARRNLMNIAIQLSRFEKVNMLVSPNDMTEAKTLLASLLHGNTSSAITLARKTVLPNVESGGKVELISQAVDDLWMRDTGPVFVSDSQQQWHGVNFNFNGWGQDDTGAVGWRRDPEKAKNGIATQPIKNDKAVARFILQHTQTPEVKTWLVLEGGGIEVDGEGTAICTESCILNPNRNPNRTKADVEHELLRLLGVQKVIWLPGLKAQDITDGHIDFYARFVGPHQVAYGLDNDPESPEYELTHQHKKILEAATDAKGRRLNLYPLVAPDADKVADAVISRNHWSDNLFNENSFAAGYIGFYVANKCVMMQQFGDPEADAAALKTVQALYPERTVLQMAADGLANGGGTIHCATQQQPARQTR